MSLSVFHHFMRRLLPWTLLAYVALMAMAALSAVDALYRAAVPLLVLMLAQLLPVRRAIGFAVWLVLGTVLVWLDVRGHVHAVLGTVPILVNAGLCWIFARTLLGDREPLVTRVVREVEGADRLEIPGVAAYSRAVTLYWAALTGAQTLVLGLCWAWLLLRGAEAPAWVRAWLHVGGYALPVLAMLAEYALRRWRFRGHPHLAPHAFARRLVACWPRIVRGTESVTRP